MASRKITSQCARAAERRTRIARRTTTCRCRETQKGIRMDALFDCALISIRGYAPVISGARTSSLLRRDDDDAVRGVPSILLESSVTFENAHGEHLIGAECRNVVSRVAHTIDDEEERHLSNCWRDRCSDGGRRSLRRKRTLRGAGGSGGDECDDGDWTTYFHMDFPEVASTSSVSIGCASFS